MQDIETTSTQSLMDRYYQEEQAQREKEHSLASLKVRLDAADLSMLNIIAKRFRKTRDELVHDLLSSALIDLFARIDASERKLMARDADESAKSIADDIAEENGVHTIEFKSGTWATHDRNITKIERKKAKQANSEDTNAASSYAMNPEKDDQAESIIVDSAASHANNDDEVDEEKIAILSSASVFDQ